MLTEKTVTMFEILLLLAALVLVVVYLLCGALERYSPRVTRAVLLKPPFSG